MSIDKIVDVVKNEVEKEISQIIQNAKSERESILKDAKSRIDDEFEIKMKSLTDEYNRRLTLEKLSIDSEANKHLNETISKVVDELYDEVVKLVKERILSMSNYIDIIISVITKSLSMLSSVDGTVVVLSKRDIQIYGEDVKKKLKELGFNLELYEGIIDGGVIVKQGKISIDSSLDRIIKMFDSEILNNIYKALPKVRV
ncbi:MAG: V-type ATP synthase subunit E [Spirochaetes bacterium]|nr:V-type ATP synthase subunit E [Spirochaetota bacterium]